MKFKVGDKVRVKEDLVVNNIYGNHYFVDTMENLKGKIFEIEDISSNSYRLKRNTFAWTDEMLEEVKVEVQEKTFREVNATIKEREVWENEFLEIRLINNYIDIKNKNGWVKGEHISIKEDLLFTLKRKQYSFKEAFKAYEEGKIIESCVTGDKYTFNGSNDLICKNGSNGYRKLKSIYIEEIKGKWYIND